MTDHERRSTPRRQTIQEHGIISARVRAGGDAAVLNVSEGGMLLETLQRLLPGTNVELHIAAIDRRIVVRGRVIRSAVACLRHAAVRYHGAVAFERSLGPFLDVDGYVIPSSGPGHLEHDREDATPPTL